MMHTDCRVNITIFYNHQHHCSWSSVTEWVVVLTTVWWWLNTAETLVLCGHEWHESVLWPRSVPGAQLVSHWSPPHHHHTTHHSWSPDKNQRNWKWWCLDTVEHVTPVLVKILKLFYERKIFGSIKLLDTPGLENMCRQIILSISCMEGTQMFKYVISLFEYGNTLSFWRNHQKEERTIFQH